jgi:endonuclease G
MEHRDAEELIEILGTQAMIAPIGPPSFFRNLVLNANLPKPFVMEVIGGWTGNPDVDARSLVNWANNKGINPQDPRFTVLGSLLQPFLQKSLLQPFLQKVDLDTASSIVALIVRYNLFRDPGLLEGLPIQLRTPSSIISGESSVVEFGPDFNWRGPTDEQDLQSLFQPRQVTSLDVAFIQRGIQQAASVCRIEIPDPATGETMALGTGFLVKQNLLLTNYHVLAANPDSDPHAYLSDLVLHFGYLTSSDGQAMEGQRFKLAAHPIRRLSPVDRLDYSLLQVEDSILEASDLRPVTINAQKLPSKGMGISLLHHSEGQTMKIDLSANGITGVYAPEGLIQYFGNMLGGSSGSPCFNDDWQVVALHHAQKSGMFGVYCEGILMSRIYQEIVDDLSD